MEKSLNLESDGLYLTFQLYVFPIAIYNWVNFLRTAIEALKMNKMIEYIVTALLECLIILRETDPAMLQKSILLKLKSLTW